MHFHLFFLHRLIKEITYREFQRYHGKPPTPPVISDIDYESGCQVPNVKCPMKWTKGALKALHEAVENYMVSLMEDANLLAIHARRATLQPQDIQLACRIWGEPNWMDIGYL